jgi:hypothetical protein
MKASTTSPADSKGEPHGTAIDAATGTGAFVIIGGVFTEEFITHRLTEIP